MTPNLMKATTKASILLPLLILVAACTGGTPPGPPPPAQPVQAPGKSVLRVFESNNGGTVILAPGQELIISLPLGYQEANSNYDWRVGEAPPASLLEPIDSHFEISPRESNATDNGGAMMWRFRAKSAGASKFVFELRRLHERALPAKTISYDIVVK